MRMIDANEVVKNIVAERDKIPRTVSTAPYELGIPKTFHAGDQMRGGIRKALRCIAQAATVGAVPVVRCKDCVNGTVFVNKQGAEYVDCVLDDYSVRKPTDYCSYGKRKEGADNG